MLPHLHQARCYMHKTSRSVPNLGQQNFRDRVVVAFASSVPAAGGNEGGETTASLTEVSGAVRFITALYQFSRPHTMLGTTISILSISLLALQGTALTPAITTGFVQALISALLMNISIVGTNQLYDIEIDKINKPYLPLASGDFSIPTGITIVVLSTVASLLIGQASGSTALMATLVISWLLGLAYSMELPFMRWKRSPVLAATCILCIRAIAVQLGFYWHMRHCMASPDALMGATWSAVSQATQQLPIPVIFTVSFMLLFSVVIALFKDIPDAKGDSRAGLQTITVKMGVAAPFWACIWILTAAYIGACGYSVVSASMSTPIGATMAASAAPASLSLVPALPMKALVSISGHGILAWLLWRRALQVDLSKKEDITSCYMHIWKLFYAEYMLIPFFA